MTRRKYAQRGKRIVLISAGTAVLFTAIPPLSGQAATGEFDYYTSQRAEYTIVNPAPGKCITTQNAIYATNGTNQPIQVYSSPNCSTLPLGTVGSGDAFQGAFNSIRAVS
jgi:hypothetical protein